MPFSSSELAAYPRRTSPMAPSVPPLTHLYAEGRLAFGSSHLTGVISPPRRPVSDSGNFLTRHHRTERPLHLPPRSPRVRFEETGEQLARQCREAELMEENARLRMQLASSCPCASRPPPLRAPPAPRQMPSSNPWLEALALSEQYLNLVDRCSSPSYQSSRRSS
ncbi:hypothetical protein DIPPA_14717 [Diplonema papillatum]|nr:hypothetical protein DIPPA_14717 [Diplonema papillatum]